MRLAAKGALVLAAFGLAASGCAPQTISPPVVREATSYPSKATRAGLTVAADAYADPDKSKAVFEMEMVAKGILAVNLVFENASDKKFFVYSNQITYRDANEQDHERLQATQVAALVEGKGGFGGATASSGVSVGLVGVGTRADPSTAQRFLEVSLAGSVLAPRSRAHGFVFFGLGEGRVVTGTVLVPVHDSTEDKILVFEIPVP